MAKPFKFRYVNEIVGAFVLLIVILLMAGILLAGRAQEWFTPVRHYGLLFPVEGSMGIQKGAEVKLLEYTVGKVERVGVQENGRMTGEISVKGDFIGLVRQDSKAIIKLQFGVAGAAFIAISEGKAAELTEGAVLTCTKDVDLFQEVQQKLQLVEKLVTEYTALAADLRSTNGPLMGVLFNLEAITAGLKNGEGAAGEILRGTALTDEVKAILAKVDAALAQTQQIVADVQKTTAQLPPMAQAVGGEVKNLPGTVIQTQETIREAERLLEGLQRHWLLRGSMPQPEPTDPIAPGEVLRP